jgi:hypothetical protein
MTAFVTKQGSQMEPLDLALTDKNGTPIDLTTVTSVVLYLRNPLTDVLLLNGVAMQVVSPATSGIVRYQWSAPDVAASGLYFAETKITWPSGRPQFVPADGYVVVRVTENLET